MDVIGVGSLTIILLTGFFTGGVMTLQTFPTLAFYGQGAQTGKLVAISLDTRARSSAMCADGLRSRWFSHSSGTGLDDCLATD